jgi:hypothetical protein
MERVRPTAVMGGTTAGLHGGGPHHGTGVTLAEAVFRGNKKPPEYLLPN